MARKSRVSVEKIEVQVAAKIERIPTAIYARLSVENSGKSEDKDVIRNQIEICENYIAENTEFDLIEIFIENGKTGTNFDRPQFNRLMDDIKVGKIKCLVVRDLSRFGRDYIETGNYLERIFPNIGLRFISIKEKYDSAMTDSSNESLMIPLQNMINALYSKDISRKVATAHRTRMSQSDFRKSTVPYGYKLDETRTQILVDEEVAPFVQKIFEWKIAGLTISKIINHLEELNAPNTDFQKAKTEVCKRKNIYKTKWKRPTVEHILLNPTYVGDTVVGRTETALYKGMLQKVINDKSNWIVYPNTHTGIITREDFEKVNQMILKSKAETLARQEKSKSDRKKLVDVLDGKIFCADCSYRMYYKRDFVKDKWKCKYVCSSYVMKRENHCKSHRIHVEDVEKKVLDAIKMQVKVALDYEKLLIKLKDSKGERSIRDKQNALIASINIKLNDVVKKRTRLYEDFVDGILTEEEYSFAKSSYDYDFDRLNCFLEDATKRKRDFNDAMSSNNKWIQLMKSVSRARKLTPGLVQECIEKVLIHDGGDIELIIKYSDIYALTISAIKEVQKEKVA